MISIPPVKTSLLLLNCVNQLLISNTTKTPKVLVINYEEKLEIPTFRYDWRKGELPVTTENPDIYIVNTETNILHETFQYLQKRLVFNPKAKFIFITNALQKETFLQYFTESYIDEMIVIEDKSKESFFLDKYKSFREEKSSSTVFTMLEHCFYSRKGIECNKSISVPIEYPSLKIGLSYNVPSVIFNGDDSFEGIDIEVLRTIASKMELSLDFEVVDEFAGMRIMENFSFNGALGSLEKREVDLVIGGILPRSDSILFFEYTKPTAVNRYVWIVPAARTRPLWKRVILTYTFSVWISLFLTFLTVGIMLSCINGIIKENFRLDSEFLKLYSMCLTSVAVKYTELVPKKILFVSWYLFLLVFSNYFTAKLLSNLMLDKYEYQVRTTDEVLNFNWKICMFTDLAEYITSLGNKKVITCDNCEYCTNRTAFKRDLVSIRSENIVSYDMHRMYLNKKGEPMLFILDQYFLVTYDVVVFRKNHPHFSRFDKLLSIMIENGIYGKIASKYTPKRKSKQKIVWKPLAYKKLSFIFKFIMYGLIFSFFVFVLEVNLKSENISASP